MSIDNPFESPLAVEAPVASSGPASATPTQRVAATFLDVVLVVPFGFLALVVVVVTLEGHPAKDAVGYGVLAGVPVLAWVVGAAFEASAWQATPGKRFIGIATTDALGERASMVRTLVRGVARVVVAASGVLVVTLGADVALWDQIAGTRVIQLNPAEQAAVNVIAAMGVCAGALAMAGVITAVWS